MVKSLREELRVWFKSSGFALRGLWSRCESGDITFESGFGVLWE